jgi:hypothetical protein
MRSTIILAVITAVALAGCSGGAGGGVLTVPPGQPSPQNPNTNSQSAAQAAMSPVSAGDLTSGLLNGAYGTTLSVVTHDVRPMQTPTCTNRHEVIVTQLSQTETQYEIKYFYDRACTELGKDVVADVTLASQSSETIARTAKWYNLSGTELANRASNFSITGSPGNFAAVLTSAFYVGTSDQPVNQFGGQFNIAAQNADTYTVAGDHADIYNDVAPKVDASFGVSAALQNVTASVDDSGDVTFSGSRSITLAESSLYGLTMPNTPPFSVGGGSVIGSGTSSGSVEFDANGDLIGVNLTVNTVKGFTVVMTSSGSPVTVDGTVTNPSDQQVATFTVDQFGDGVITYANGAQGLIIDWHIVG